jgi:hypothetical protein
MPSARHTTVHQAAWDLLWRLGVRRVFGNPGSTEMPFLADSPDDIEYVLGLREAAVVGMADAYAQSTGQPTLVNPHTAAGLGNAMGAIANAAGAHSPLVITAGQQVRAMLTLEPMLANPEPTLLPKPGRGPRNRAHRSARARHPGGHPPACLSPQHPASLGRRVNDAAAAMRALGRGEPIVLIADAPTHPTARLVLCAQLATAWRCGCGVGHGGSRGRRRSCPGRAAGAGCRSERGRSAWAVSARAGAGVRPSRAGLARGSLALDVECAQRDPRARRRTDVESGRGRVGRQAAIAAPMVGHGNRGSSGWPGR